MRQWMRSARGAIGMGLAWAVVWAPAAVLLGLLVDADGSMDEMWIAVGAYAGFLAGVLFAAVLGVLARRRRFHELSVPRCAAWGALAGLLVGTIPLALGTSALPLWRWAAAITAPLTALGAASAAASLALARRAEARSALRGGSDDRTARLGEPR